MHTKKPTITPTPQPGFVELRGKSGRLYGYYDPHRQVIEVKRGDVKETLHLADYLPKQEV